METKHKVIIIIAIVAILAAGGALAYTQLIAPSQGTAEEPSEVSLDSADYWTLGDPETGRVSRDNIDGLDKVAFTEAELTSLEDFLTKRFHSEDGMDDAKFSIEEAAPIEDGYRAFRLVDKSSDEDYLLQIGDVWTIEKDFDANYESQKAEAAAEETERAALEADIVAAMEAEEQYGRQPGATIGSTPTGAQSAGGGSSSNTSAPLPANTVALNDSDISSVIPAEVSGRLRDDIAEAMSGKSVTVGDASTIRVGKDGASVSGTTCKFTAYVPNGSGYVALNCVYDSSSGRHTFEIAN